MDDETTRYDGGQDDHTRVQRTAGMEDSMEQQRRLGDRYEVGELLGRGGMAEVHTGRDLRLGRVVAVKSLRRDLARDSSFQTRFRREAQSAASLNHPNIVAVYDTGEEVTPGGDGVAVPFIVMEQVEGTTLRDLMSEHRRLLPERALEITSAVLDALEYSHGRGIVHRDIKPANVMLTDAGEVKVMDFGIARAIADSQSTMTQTGATLGTAQYLSPEQAQGGPVDPRSDIYSTGCMLYELLTGRPPFTGESPVSVAYQHVRENPLPPSQVDPDVPPAVDQIVMKSLAKNPDNRYQSAGEMREDIARLLAGRPVAATPLADETRAITTVTPTADVVAGSNSVRNRRIAFVVVGLLIAAAIIAGILALLSGGGGAKQVSVPDLVGLTEAEATNQLEAKGLSVGDKSEVASDLRKGLVVDQIPAVPGTVDEGGSVDLVLSSGPERVPVPTLVDLTVDTAREALTEAGLTLGKIDPQPSDKPEGIVIDSAPKVGKEVAKGSAVDLVVSNGELAVPDVVGLTEARARAALENAGFKPSVERRVTSQAEEGVVYDQSPEAETPARADSVVVITVAVAPEVEPTQTTPTPTVSTSLPSEEEGGVGD